MRLSVVRWVPFFALGVACSMEPAGVPGTESARDENVGRASSAVINGSLDTAHPAVVALILAQGSQGGLCSGTIVKKDVQRGIGWVATAAHCVEVPPAIVVQAQDFSSPDAIRYSVIDFEADPRYSPQRLTYDFAMVRIAGVDESTPVIPLTSAPDGVVARQTSVTSVGFGRTSLVEPTSPDDQNTQRRMVTKTVDEVTATRLGYDMRTQGICQGDSGGPVLLGSGSNQRVVGIHSYVQGDCNGRGYSGRVTAALDFYEQELTKSLPADSCALCEKIANSGKQECAAMSASCLADKDCRGYYECLSSGKSATSCFATYPLAEGPFYAAANCVCGRACADQCKGSSSCRGVPKCGYKMDPGDCAKCVEASCCQEETDCAADGQCYVCLKEGDADPACAKNAARKKLAECAKSKCTTECADSGIQAGGDDAAPEGEVEAAATTTRTTTTTGCATSSGASSSSVLALVLGALVTAGARRRRRG
ncbi:MAG: S1 family peptidase [Labilithrix sp.]|nr:S1 family peptidase [Labilithrix sp.]